MKIKKNIIIGEININKYGVYNDIQIINSYENAKRNKRKYRNKNK